MFDVAREIEELRRMSEAEWAYIRKSRELREFIADTDNPRAWRAKAAHELRMLMIEHGDLMPGDPGWFEAPTTPGAKP